MQPWNFVHTTDIHFGSPRSYRYDPARNENWATACSQMESMQPEILLVGGDLTRDGDPHEYEMQIAKDELEKLPMVYAVIPGNVEVGNKHTTVVQQKVLDVNSENLKRFGLYFGAPNWTFVHKNVRFTGFYAGVAGSGLSEEQMFWHFLERLSSLPIPRHHVAMMHYPLFIETMDEPNYDPADPNQYHEWYNNIDQPHRSRIFRCLRDADVEIVLSGHTHCRRSIRTVEGVRFCWTPATGGTPQYTESWLDGDATIGFHLLKVSEEQIDIEFVPVQPLSTKTCRGPLGHFYTNNHAARGCPDEYDDEIQKRIDTMGISEAFR